MGAALGHGGVPDEGASSRWGSASEPSRDEPSHRASASHGDQERRTSPARDPAVRSQASRGDALPRSSTLPDDRDGPPGSIPGASPEDGAGEERRLEAPEDEVERLRQELLALREERREVMGEPVAPPADLEPRFSGSVMSGAVGVAFEQANVPGAVEATDCSEHPCIVFGRLEGDEEEMEEVERTAALSTYDGDVLTLLFWATSVEEPGATPAETGLFALAFYSFEDRAARGEELDRRIRARTMEYWNHDRPGRAPTE